ncbi:MAG: acetyl-CoA decarbonylase/synthase complex subunit delta [Eubacteriales bacterium]
MAFVPKTQAYNASINAVTLGTGDKAITIGGENTLPFYTFDAPMANRPAIGVEIPDVGVEGLRSEGSKAFFEGCTTAADMAKKAESMEGADFICLNMESSDPNGADMAIEDAVAIAKAVSEATTMPIVVMGCKNAEKDGTLLGAVSDAMQGKNILAMSATEENYKGVGASVGLAYNQKVGAESAVDINLAKQLNVMLSQLGVAASSVVMNAGSAAAGYGYEYVASTLDRVKLAAMAQSDNMLQMPIITPVSTEAAGVKESIMPEADMPEWGNIEERRVEMEITTATASIMSGSNAVIMSHPEAIKTMAAFVDALM